MGEDLITHDNVRKIFDAHMRRLAEAHARGEREVEEIHIATDMDTILARITDRLGPLEAERFHRMYVECLLEQGAEIRNDPAAVFQRTYGDLPPDLRSRVSLRTPTPPETSKPQTGATIVILAILALVGVLIGIMLRR